MYCVFPHTKIVLKLRHLSAETNLLEVATVGKKEIIQTILQMLVCTKLNPS